MPRVRPKEPAGEPDLVLSDGTRVWLKTPGVLFQQQVFRTLPDLVSSEDAQAAQQAMEDRGVRTQLSILMVVYGCRWPRYSAERFPEDGTISVDELEPPDFRKVVETLEQRLLENRRAEAQEVRPLSKAGTA